jgi:hypothetical protein
LPHRLPAGDQEKGVPGHCPSGIPVTFEAVARAAGVSQSWLYGQPDLWAQIQHLRESTRRASAPPVPVRQRTSDASLLARLQASLQKNRRLAEENQRLRRQLAQALGDQGISVRNSQKPSPSRDTPRRTSITIGPC